MTKSRQFIPDDKVYITVERYKSAISSACISYFVKSYDCNFRILITMKLRVFNVDKIFFLIHKMTFKIPEPKILQF